MNDTTSQSNANGVASTGWFAYFCCAVLGHIPALNGQQYEAVRVHKLDGTTTIETRLIEREWCRRCRKLVRTDLANNRGQT